MSLCKALQVLPKLDLFFPIESGKLEKQLLKFTGPLKLRMPVPSLVFHDLFFFLGSHLFFLCFFLWCVLRFSIISMCCSWLISVFLIGFLGCSLLFLQFSCFFLRCVLYYLFFNGFFGVASIFFIVRSCFLGLSMVFSMVSLLSLGSHWF